MTKIYTNRGNVVFKGKSPDQFTKRYSINSIGLIKYSYFDDSEESILISVFLKPEIENIIGNLSEFPHDIISDKIKEHESHLGWVDRNNKLEVYSEDGNDITVTILNLIKVCSSNNIYLLQPDCNDSMFSRFADFNKQQEAIDWWKDDVIFRAFSKN